MLESGTETLLGTKCGMGTPMENTVPFAVMESVALPMALDLMANVAIPLVLVVVLPGVIVTPPKVVLTVTVATATGDAGNAHPRAMTVSVITVVLSAGTSLRSKILLEVSSQTEDGAASALGARSAKRSEAIMMRARRIGFERLCICFVKSFFPSSNGCLQGIIAARPLAKINKYLRIHLYNLVWVTLDRKSTSLN